MLAVNTMQLRPLEFADCLADRLNDDTEKF